MQTPEINPPPVPAPPSEAPGLLTELPYDRSLFNVALMLVIVLSAVGVSIAIIFALGPNSPLPLVLILFSVGSIVAAQYTPFWPKPAAMIRRLEQSRDPANDLLAELPKMRGFRVSVFVEQAAKALADAGHKNMTFRCGAKEGRGSVAPSDVLFEPRMFGDLAERDRDSEKAPTSEFYRRIMLKGGWGLVLMFGINIVIGVLNSFAHRRVMPQLLWWSFALLVLLLVPVRASLLMGHQWLLAPSALIRRKSRRGGGWDLKVFDRRKSVMIVYHAHRHQWGVSVADRDSFGSTVGTVEEVNDLLSSWLSPFPAPEESRLSDLQAS